MLVGYRVEQGADGVLLVIDWKIGRGQDRRFVTALLKEVSEDQDQVPRLLRAGGHKHLVFEQLEELRRERPRIVERPSDFRMVRRRRLRQARVLRDVGLGE